MYASDEGVVEEQDFFDVGGSSDWIVAFGFAVIESGTRHTRVR